MHTYLRTFCVLLILSTFTACETLRVGSPHHVVGSTYKPTREPPIPIKCSNGLIPIQSEICDQARANQQELQWYRDNEWQFNRSDTTQPPLVCVSFSGGGIRAAAFAIGVLQGLSKISDKSSPSRRSLLDQIDILSGTSGGSYALSWYYMQRQQGKKGIDLFDDVDKAGTVIVSPAQTELRDHADFLTLPKYVGSGFANVVVLSPVNALLNGVLGTHTNTSFADWLYQKTIRDTFHSGIPTTLTEIRTAFLGQKQPDLPYFIITTTSRIDENTFHFDSLLSNTVFEFTPLRVGNDGFTYINSDYKHIGDLELARIVAIAGAALDSSQVVSGSSQRFFASILNADYGQYIYNYNDTRHEFRRLVTKLFPFPFYFFTESYNHDMRGSDIYLSDGGHQENLAVYPLIRRQCQNILIVDAEYDPAYEFESYFKVKHSIEREMRVNMTLHPTSFCPGRPDLANCKDNDVDAIEPALREASESGMTREEADYNLINVPQCCFSRQHPVMEGKIGYFPILDEGKQEVQWRETKLLYVKLAIDTNLFQGWETFSEDRKKEVKGKIGDKAAEYYAATVRDTCKIQYFWNRCTFPQYSTIHQSFTSDQFDAYVDLGATMIKNHITTTDGRTLQLKPQANAQQKNTPQ